MCRRIRGRRVWVAAGRYERVFVPFAGRRDVHAAIRRLANERGPTGRRRYSQAAIARMFGVGQQHVSRILKGRTTGRE